MPYLLERTELAVCALVSTAIAGAFIAGAIARPEIHRAITVGPAAVFAVLSAFAAYRTFTRDEWFAERERKRQESWSRYPLLMSSLFLFGTFSFVWQVIRELKKHGIL